MDTYKEAVGTEPGENGGRTGRNGPGDLKFDLVSSESGFQGLERAWKALQPASAIPNLTSSFEWLWAWWETFKGREDAVFGYSKRLRIVLASSGGELRAIFPFMAVRRGPRISRFEYLEFLGQPWGATSLDLVGNADPGLAARALDWSGRNLRYHLLHLRYLPRGGPLLSELAASSHPFSACPIIPLRAYEGFEAYQGQAYSKSLKQNLRTAANKMKAEGLDWTSRISRVGPAELAEMERLSGQKLADGKSSLYADPGKAAFVRKVCAKMDAEVLFIRLGEANVAYRLNFMYGNRKFCFDASYDRAYPRFELGALSVQESIKDSFAKGLDAHCEGTGIDAYKLKFTKEALPIFAVAAKGRGLFAGPLQRRAQRKAALLGGMFTGQWEKAVG
jgi:CelD/BcsL family acetyltransferase involved in cellulose biosynthesis